MTVNGAVPGARRYRRTGQPFHAQAATTQSPPPPLPPPNLHYPHAATPCVGHTLYLTTPRPLFDTCDGLKSLQKIGPQRPDFLGIHINPFRKGDKYGIGRARQSPPFRYGPTIDGQLGEAEGSLSRKGGTMLNPSSYPL